MTLERFIDLLDWTGRQLLAGTPGVIPPLLESILVRLQVFGHPAPSFARIWTRG